MLLVDGAELTAWHRIDLWLPLGDAAQTPDDYLDELNATTGMPFVMAVQVAP